MRNPRKYCVDCGRRYSLFDEACEQCGFEPIGKDEDRQEAAEEEYLNAEG